MKERTLKHLNRNNKYFSPEVAESGDSLEPVVQPNLLPRGNKAEWCCFKRTGPYIHLDPVKVKRTKNKIKYLGAPAPGRVSLKNPMRRFSFHSFIPFYRYPPEGGASLRSSDSILSLESLKLLNAGNNPPSQWMQAGCWKVVEDEKVKVGWGTQRGELPYLGCLNLLISLVPFLDFQSRY
eukprot:TRINITY_DN3413_c0_g2_i4.p1 TRINITY_DN3413_c0_g2~~TRINITY_DN3413_c0_g2_i4.p1  ORF type:complete len:180 (-),score=6.42 TRINITY_DN3413_c0_g2_i4:52-591(-)